MLLIFSSFNIMIVILNDEKIRLIIQLYKNKLILKYLAIEIV
jgi:hypothetical protein